MKPKTDHRYFKITVFLTVVCSGLFFSNFETAAQASDRTVVNERGSLEAVFNDGESVWTLSALELPSGAARDIEWRETQLYAPNAASERCIWTLLSESPYGCVLSTAVSFTLCNLTLL